MPNCIMKAKSEKRRAFVGDQVDDCRDLSSLFYLLPTQKGYLVIPIHQVAFLRWQQVEQRREVSAVVHLVPNEGAPLLRLC